MQISPCTLKMRVIWPQNRAPCFATFLQNELNNDVACFTTHGQTCIATKEVVVGCEKLLQKVESSSTFCNKICTCCASYRPKANLFCNKWRISPVRSDSHVILSNQKSVFKQPAATWFVARQVWTWVVKRATSLLNSSCSNVSKQNALFCCTFYRSFIQLSAHLVSRV